MIGGLCVRAGGGGGLWLSQGQFQKETASGLIFAFSVGNEAK